MNFPKPSKTTLAKVQRSAPNTLGEKHSKAIRVSGKAQDKKNAAKRPYICVFALFVI